MGKMRSVWGRLLFVAALAAAAVGGNGMTAPAIQVTDEGDQLRIQTPALEAAVRRRGYVSGVAGGSLLDRKSGFHDLGYGLDIVDWLMETGSDEAYRDQLTGDLKYEFNNPYHGKRPKRSIEGPQVCTRAREVDPQVIRGDGFVAVRMEHRYTIAAPGKKTGSRWEQTLVFPAGERYFVSSDRVTTVNDSDGLFMRLDMPGHIKHNGADTFSEVYLSYRGRVPASEFQQDFAPDEKLLYVRDDHHLPKRFIRAYHIRDPKTGKDGPWLAGMTLAPSVVSEAWCHQRSYVCLIEEFGGRPIRAGQSFGAAFVVGFFDSIPEMERVYDRYSGATGLEVSPSGWKLTRP